MNDAYTDNFYYKCAYIDDAYAEVGRFHNDIFCIFALPYMHVSVYACFHICTLRKLLCKCTFIHAFICIIYICTYTKDSIMEVSSFHICTYTEARIYGRCRYGSVLIRCQSISKGCKPLFSSNNSVVFYKTDTISSYRSDFSWGMYD